MDSSSIHVSSKTAPAHLENFLEAAKGKTIVIEDKYRKSTGTIRLGVREGNSDRPEDKEEKAKTRQALHHAISTVLESRNRTAALFFLKTLMQPSGNCDALFIPNTTQLKFDVLEMLFKDNFSLESSAPIYRSGNQPHLIDSTLTPAEYLSLPSPFKRVRTPKELADMARTGDLEKNSSNPAFAQIFVKDFDRKAQSDAYLYEKLDGEKGEFRTLAEFAEFVGPGDQNGFKNGANLVTVVSYLTSQELPLFLNAAILKSASTPIKSATGEPIFFISNLTSIYSLKKRADGGIMLTYKGTCSPEGIRVSSDVIAASIKLRSPGSVTIECDIIFRPNGDIEYGNVRSHAQGLDF